ncbi:MAG: glycine cleavage system aminomethyltransferase GcvT [Acidimicrobiia bacterium]|nr:glycine cleavage system aminomethyltransferase GcvT [Acidimicrobiia bacterium]
MSEVLRETVLGSRHVALGAKMVPFAGWRMPIQYEGTVAEHLAVREACGLFDVGHMGTVFVRGPDTADLLQRTLTNDVTKVGPGRAQYTMLLNDRGGVVDDLIISHVAEDEWMVVPNAANVTTVVAILDSEAERSDGVEVTDLSSAWGILALQGPRWSDVVEDVLTDAAPARFGVARFESRLGQGIVSGTGYTGSPGIEIVAPNDTIVGIWDALGGPLADVGGKPAGLGARDTLRLEMGYPLHGHDISPDISPLEAGLGWTVALDSADFPGAAALRRQKEDGVPRRLVGLVGRDRRPLRDASPVLDTAAQAVGVVTSGGYSPLLERGIALALVARDAQPASVELRGRHLPVEVVDPPFVDLP